MKRCKIGISCELMSKLLTLPKKARIAGVEFDSKHGCIYIYLCNVGKDLSECEVAKLSAIEDL